MQCKRLVEETQPSLLQIKICCHIKDMVFRKDVFLCLLVVKRELEAEASALAGKEKAATAEVCIVLIC